MALCIVLTTGCAHIDRFDQKSWVLNEFIIDGLFRIDIELPSNKPEMGGLRDQFIVTEEGVGHRLFIANYDRGYGRVRDLNYTHISGTIIPFRETVKFDGKIDSEEIMATIYRPAEDPYNKFMYEGDHVHAGITWTRIDRKLEWERGISYVAPIFGRHVLILNMTTHGEYSDETELFRLREQTLIQVVNSVRVDELR